MAAARPLDAGMPLVTIAPRPLEATTADARPRPGEPLITGEPLVFTGVLDFVGVTTGDLFMGEAAEGPFGGLAPPLINGGIPLTEIPGGN